MNFKSTKIVFFGSSKYVIPIIEVLNKNFNLEFVVTTEKATNDPVIKYCYQNKIKFISLKSFSAENWKNKKPQSQLAVLASFGVIVPQEIINLFFNGIINLHPSLLPKYRGTTPVQTAILNGDKKTGISIMLLDKEMDHGPILAQKKETILDTDTADTLYTRLFTLGSEMLSNIIYKYLEKTLIPKEQNHTLATFTKPLTRASGYINLEKNNDSKFLARAARALYPWPGVWTKWKMKNNNFKIIKLLPKNYEDNFLIQIEGKKPLTVKDFLNGYPDEKEFLKKLKFIR